MKNITIVSGLIFIFSSLQLFAAPLTGIKTIGGINPDYPTFSAAVSALGTEGVGPGGVT